MHETSSAGGVVLNPDGQVLVVSQHGNSWSLPKGHIDPGEDARTAAAREIWEESGVKSLKYVRELGNYQRYRIGIDGGEEKSELKNIHIFLYTTEEVDLNPQDKDHPEARWVDIDKVAELLTHPKDKEFFTTCCSQFSSELKNK